MRCTSLPLVIQPLHILAFPGARGYSPEKKYDRRRTPDGGHDARQTPRKGQGNNQVHAEVLPQRRLLHGEHIGFLDNAERYGVLLTIRLSLF